MRDNFKSEIEYLEELISSVSYQPDRFRLYIGKDRYLFGTLSPDDKETVISRLMQIKTLYDTLKDLDWKIKVSLEKSLKFAYTKSVQEDFNPIKATSEEENYAYYYLENALFRTSTLWDILAQLYRLFYKIDVRTDKVYYNKIFNPNSNHSNKFKDKANEIYNYINEDNNTYIDGKWKGNHKFINNHRNKMTHRNSPSITSMSDFDFNFKNPPNYILKRLIEDYTVVSEFISEILDEFEIDIFNIF